MERGQVVLVDTNIIIEAVRIKCWSAVTGQFQIETVEKCCEEARTGDLHRPGYVQVSETALRTRLTVHPVSKTELANLALQDAESFRLAENAISGRKRWGAMMIGAPVAATMPQSTRRFGLIGKIGLSRLKNSSLMHAESARLGR
jgi:hypothetical protein